MPADDELLRQLFEQEARMVPRTHDARAVLSALEPALRRAAIKRAALLTASAAILIGGAAAVALEARAPEGAISVSARPTPLESVPPITAVPDPTAAVPASAPVGRADAPDSPSGRSPSPIVTAETETSPSVAALPPVVTQPPAPAPVAAPAAPAPASPADPQPAPTSVVAPPASTTVAPTLVTYVSECGTVVADLSTDPPTITSIDPDEGVEVHIEDPDHGRITVHLTGRDEECEIEVGGTPGPEEPHPSHADEATAREPGDD